MEGEDTFATTSASSWSSGQVIIAALLGVAATALVAGFIGLAIHFTTKRNRNYSTESDTTYLENRFFEGHAPFGHNPTSARFPRHSEIEDMYESAELDYNSSLSSFNSNIEARSHM